MEQLYMVEIFIDKVTIFVPEDDESEDPDNKKLIIKVKFGPKIQFIIKEAQLAKNEIDEENEEVKNVEGKIENIATKNKKNDVAIENIPAEIESSERKIENNATKIKKNDVAIKNIPAEIESSERNTEIFKSKVETDAQGKRKWCRIIRVGKSYLFPSYSDTVLLTLSKFPLEIEVWNDDETEKEIFVGIGTLHWDTDFFHMLKETSNANRLHEPLTIKQKAPLFAECCCRRVGNISFILRVSALGDSIITEFQQLMQNPDEFVFRTNKAPSMFKCIRVDGDDPNFCMIGSLYESATLEDPDIIRKAQTIVEVCTETQSCGMALGAENACQHGEEVEKKKKYAIDKIKMGDIIGPCGNTTCPLAQRVRCYIRKLDSYKKQYGTDLGLTTAKTDNICGSCICRDDRWHREKCPAKNNGKNTALNKCEVCEDNKKKLFGTGATPPQSQTVVAYMYSVTKESNIKESTFGREYMLQNLNKPAFAHDKINTSMKPKTCCCCKNSETSKPDFVSNITHTESTPNISLRKSKSITCGFSVNNPFVYNVDVKSSKNQKAETSNFSNCTDIPISKDCKCDPPLPKPPCRTFNCNCIMEQVDKANRKIHKPYCPSYKHKSDCPVLEVVLTEEEEMLKKKQEEEYEEAEPLPYGLPPIKLGPCPVLGRPCTVPDGFARMYKVGAMQKLPPSYSDAGKVCCSKEFERIKSAIAEYMKKEKENDFRCVNTFIADTERRCCDKEQVLYSLMGKECCGSHKLSIQDKFRRMGR